MGDSSKENKDGGVVLSKRKSDLSAVIMPFKQSENTVGKKKKPSKKRKKRVRGQKIKDVRVTGVGELPDVKRLKGGKVRKLNVLGNLDEDVLPRKTRDILQRMAFINKTPSPFLEGCPGNTNGNCKVENASNTLSQRIGACNSADKSHFSDRDDRNGGKKNEKNSSALVRDSRMSTANESVGQRPGESVAHLSARLREERRQLVIDAVRKTSHQHEKKKEHYRKRQERLQRRKRQRRGCVDDSSDEDVANGNMESNEVLQPGDDRMEEEMERLNELPMYWQEIVRNHGRPVSEKKRRRLERAEAKNQSQTEEKKVQFGERVERPPKISVFPKERSKTPRTSQP